MIEKEKDLYATSVFYVFNIFSSYIMRSSDLSSSYLIGSAIILKTFNQFRFLPNINMKILVQYNCSNVNIVCLSVNII